MQIQRDEKGRLNLQTIKLIVTLLKIKKKLQEIPQTLQMFHFYYIRCQCENFNLYLRAQMQWHQPKCTYC